MSTENELVSADAESRTQVLDEVKQIVAEVLSIEPDKIHENHLLEADLGCDSLDKVEISMSVSDRIGNGNEIPEDEANEIQSIAQLVDAVLRLQQSPVVG